MIFKAALMWQTGNMSVMRTIMKSEQGGKVRQGKCPSGAELSNGHQMAQVLLNAMVGVAPPPILL